MALSPVQLNIFKDRYALPGEEHPEQMWDRVARAVAEAEPEAQRHSVRDQFRDLLTDFKFVPGGRILLAMGNPAPAVTAMNCFVLPSPKDSRAGIISKSLQQWVDIQATGGGVGINLSSLRPNGAPVKSVGGTSSGPVTWAKLFAFTSHDVIIQGGSRRGAAMLMLDDNHPDIFEFIHAKETPGTLEGANLSVCISDAFMDAVRDDGLWDLKWGGEIHRTIRARQLWHEICECAHNSGEPGIFFMERANQQANSGYFEKLVSCNPCAEQALGPYGACLLGAFNLAAYVREPRNEAAYFDFDALQHDVTIAVRFNDNIIDLSSYPIEEAREAQLRIRRMGLGVMGLADVLIKLGIIYGEPESVRFTSAIFELMSIVAYQTSMELGIERGAFPAYDAKQFWSRPFASRVRKHLSHAQSMRNCYLISQAPTGTISLMAGVNSGIEPYFSFDYSRSDRIGDYDVTQAEWAETYALRRKGNAAMAPWLVTAQDIKPEAHIAIQAACQEWNDSSVSKTINAPNNATVEDVKRAYMLAWNSGLKSIAYYRDGSRDKQVLNYKEATPTPAIITTDNVHVHHRKRLPTTRAGLTHKFAVDGIEGYIHTGEYETGAPGEMFVDIAKVGSTIAGLVDWGATMTSLALQYGAPLEELTDKMIGTRFEPAGRTNDKEIPHATSVVDYIGAWMSSTYGSSAQPAQIAATGLPAETITVTERSTVQVPQRNGNLCPTCSTPVVYLDGCESCRNCSWSRCG